VAKILDAIGTTPDARAALEEAMETQERLVRDNPLDDRLRRGLFSLYFHLGVMRGGWSLVFANKPSVQSELKLSPDQVFRVQEISEKEERLRHDFVASRSTDMAHLRSEFRKNLDALLGELSEILKPAQAARLEQIVRQWQGVWAFADPAIANDLGLSPAQRSRIYAIQEDSIGFPAFRSDDRRTLDQRLLAVLTPAQRQAWQELLGAPYDHEETFRRGPSRFKRR
jgi:hypothetical protein